MWIGTEQHKVIGARLAELRRSAGVTQADLAASLEKPQSFVSAFESGQRRLDLLEFARIVETLGGNPSEIAKEVWSGAKPRRKNR